MPPLPWRYVGSQQYSPLYVMNVFWIMTLWVLNISLFIFIFVYYFDPLAITFYIRLVVTWWVLIFLTRGPSYIHLWLHTYKANTHAISRALQQFWKPCHQNQLLLNKSLHSYYMFATKDWVEGAKGWRVHY